MIRVNSDFSISFSLFDQFPNLFCAVSTRIVDAEKLIKQSSTLPVRMEQVHGNSVAFVNEKDRGAIVAMVDGILTNSSSTYLSVGAADCVPIFFYDPVKKIIGVAHSGWRGTYKNIAAKIIEEFKKLGSEVKNIYVAIGPHIGGCCYEISKDLAEKFLVLFKNNLKIVFLSQNKWFLDLGQAIRQQLVNAGILPANVDSQITCTSCQNDRYFSYRKNKNTTRCGQMTGIIGLKN